MTSLHPVGVSAPTHQSAKQFKHDLQEAVRRCVPTGRKPYSRVLFVPLLWDNSGTEFPTLLEAVEALKDLFQKRYKFTTYKIAMPTRQPSKAATKYAVAQLSSLLQHVIEDTLIILHYAGHAAMEGKDCILVSDTYTIAPPVGPPARGSDRANFNLIIKATTELESAHVLYLIDCCYAAGAGLECDKELLAACDIATTTSATLGGNFTRHLYDALEENGGVPITVAQLHGKLYKYYTGIPGRIGLDRLPFHAELHPDMQGSIVLAPLKKGASTEPRTHYLHTPKVVIIATLSSLPDVPDVEQWQKCLTSNLSPNITNLEIQVSGIHQGGSIFVILTLPVSVWDAMRGDTAYHKVPSGPIQGGNLLLHAPTPSQPSLAVRPKPPGGLENVKPGPSN